MIYRQLFFSLFLLHKDIALLFFLSTFAIHKKCPFISFLLYSHSELVKANRTAFLLFMALPKKNYTKILFHIKTLPLHP